MYSRGRCIGIVENILFSQFRENSSWFRIVNDESYHLIQIILTNACNLRCVYCYQDHKVKEQFELVKVLESVYDALEDHKDESIVIHFFGGEPLLEFGLVQQLTSKIKAEWVRHGGDEKNLTFGIVTNGTLVDDEKKEWFLAHPEVKIFLSLDGNKQIQDKNRSNSYDLIAKNFDFFLSYNIPVKMTIGPDSVDICAEGIMDLHRIGFEVQANIVLENVWGEQEKKKDHLKAFDGELIKLLSFYKKNPHIPRTTLIPPLTEYLPNPSRLSGWGIKLCGMGHNITTVNLNGSIYPCQRIMPYYDRNKNKIEFDRETLSPNECEKCELQPMCPECRSCNFEYHHSTNHKTVFHCEFTKLQLRASAFMTLHDIQKIKQEFSLKDLAEEDRIFLAQRLYTAEFIEQYTREFYQNLMQ